MGALTYWNLHGLSRPVEGLEGLLYLFYSALICIPNAPSLRFGLEVRHRNLNFRDFSQHVEVNEGTVQ
jgi:hypothetical protein